MVVTRKPSGPLPVTPSRTTSTSAIPTKAKGKAPEAQSPSPLSNGVTVEDTSPTSDDTKHAPQTSSLGAAPTTTPSSTRKVSQKASKSKGKTKDRELPPKTSTTRYGTWLFRISLALFSIYCLTICPTDYLLDSPVCYGLSKYREQVLEPYVLPPVRALTNHPSVGPYVETAYTKLQPPMQSVIRASRIAHATVMPPTQRYWRQVVYPRLLLLETQLEPLWIAVQRKFGIHVNPYIQMGQARLDIVLNQLAPYHNRILVLSKDSWRVSQPYITPVVQTVRETPGFLYYRVYLPSTAARRTYVDPHVVKAYAKWAPLIAEYRRQYVDLHILKMWARIQELARGSTTASKSTSASSEITPPPTEVTPDVVAEPVPVPEAEVSPEPTLESMDPVPTPEPTEVQLTFSAITTETSEGESTEPSVVPPQPEEREADSTDEGAAPSTLPPDASESSVGMDSTSEPSQITFTEFISPSSSAEVSDAPISPGILDALAESASITNDSIPVTDIPNEATPLIPDLSNATPVSTVINPTNTDDSAQDDDYAEFLRDLQEEDPTEEEQPAPSELAPEPAPSSDEQSSEEERAAKVAEQRAEIVARHEKHEQELQALIPVVVDELIKSLSDSRAVAVSSLENLKIGIFNIGKLHDDANKALRNTNSYLKGLLADKQKTVDQKDSLWEKVLTRVDEKFTNKAQELGIGMQQWWEEQRIREGALVRAAIDRLEAQGNEAQTDLGMDYAWLEDVSYYDWQRYHALVDVSKEQTPILISIQEGTHERAPENPLFPIMSELQQDLQDIIDGFETRLTQTQQDGYDAITEATKQSNASSVPVLEMEEEVARVEASASGILNRGREEVKGAFERAGQPKPSDNKADFSILPIPDETAQPVVPDAASGLLGRGKEEVESAFERASQPKPVKESKDDFSILPVPETESPAVTPDASVVLGKEKGDEVEGTSEATLDGAEQPVLTDEAVSPPPLAIA